MMRRSTILKTSAVISLFFLIFQLINLIMLNNKPADSGTSKLQTAVTEFITVCNNLEIPVFLLDRKILADISNNVSQRDTGMNSPATFGIKNSQWSYAQKQSLQEKLEDKFTVLESRGEALIDKDLLMRTVLTHLFFTVDSTFIHLIVFYLHHPGFLWHGQVDRMVLKQLTANYEVEILYGKEQGAFDKFDLQEIQLWSHSFLVPSPLSAFIQQIPESKFIECNHTAASLFYSKFPSDNTSESTKFRRKARQLLARAKQYLDDLGIQFWLSSGTCLGWFRQCDIITYSKDVDFGIWIKDYKDDLIPVFERGGFYVKHIFGKVSDSFEISFTAGDIKLDLFFFYEEGDIMWNGGTDVDDGSKYKYIFPKFSLCWTAFLDLKIRVPCPPEPYIEANYGPDWFIPVTTWDWKGSPPNVRPNGFWPRSEWDQVMQIF